MRITFLKILIPVLGGMFSGCQDESPNAKVAITLDDLAGKQWKQIKGYHGFHDLYLPRDTFEFFNNGFYKASIGGAITHSVAKRWNKSPRTHITGKFHFDDLRQAIDWIDVDTATMLPYSRPAWIFKEKTDSTLVFETLVDANSPDSTKQVVIKRLR